MKPLPRSSRSSLVALALVTSACSGLIGDPNGRAQDGALSPSDATANADGAGRVLCDGVQAARAPMRRVTPAQYRTLVADLFDGRVQAGASFPAQTRFESDQATGFSTDPGRNVVSEGSAEQIMNAAEETAEALVPALATLLPCSAQASPAEPCATTFIQTYGRRAFRRPLTAQERDNLLGVYRLGRMNNGDFADGIAAVTTALLQMPDVLYIPEAGRLDANNLRALDDFEIASRLSFLYWDRAPDEALLSAAERGELRTRAQVEAQARRLLMSDRAVPAIMRFVREWIHIGVLAQGDRTNPEFDQRLATAIQEGFERSITTAIREQKTLRELLTSTEVFVNQRLASFYGLAPSTSSSDAQWVRVSLDPAHYAGLATMPAVLAGLSHDSDPSYVYRGVFVLQRLSCQSLGQPPGNAQSVFDMLPLAPTASATERSEAVRRRGDCVGCHSRIDPVGLAFDRFDELGRLRARDRYNNPVAGPGEVIYSSSAPLQFDGPASLMRSVAASGQCEPCVSRQWLRFTFGRIESSEDACTLQALTDRLDPARGAADASLLSMMVAMSSTDAFFYRRARETP
ncbi:MAG: DUF1592 domain-containing protein [Polyangiales bacterium]